MVNANETDAVRHGFFGRKGGVSTGLYDSLNAGAGTRDDPANIRENRARILDALGLTADSLRMVYQIHSAECVTLQNPALEEELKKADALATDRPGLALGILTADCAPVLFSGRKSDGSPVIGAAHAGWRGALGGVLENCLAAMTGLGAQPATLHAAIGPCIHQPSYEVAASFMADFTARDPAYAAFFNPGAREGVRQFDLPGFVFARLKAAGIVHIAHASPDTYANEADYFSYRRTTHRGESDYGRQLSVIAIL